MIDRINFLLKFFITKRNFRLKQEYKNLNYLFNNRKNSTTRWIFDYGIKNKKEYQMLFNKKNKKLFYVEKKEKK